MVITDTKDFFKYIRSLRYIGSGVLGSVYYDYDMDKVIKVFHTFKKDLHSSYVPVIDKDVFEKLKTLKNGTYIFADDLIMYEERIAGYITDYVPGRLLYKTNPLNINLDNFTNAVAMALVDIEKVSYSGVRSFDAGYNTIYDNKKISIIDHDDCCFPDSSKEDIYNQNFHQFNNFIKLFLIDNYFDEYVSSDKDLLEMYNNNYCDLLSFLKTFRLSLSQYVGKHITTLNEGYPALNTKNHQPKLVRQINSFL